MGCSTVVMIVILIAVAILLYFNFTDQNALISGGHIVTYNEQPLHINKFDELKDKIHKEHPDWKPDQLHSEAERIIANLLKDMKSNSEYKEWVANYIDDMIAEYHKQSQTI
jgi:hypothetical protein